MALSRPPSVSACVFGWSDLQSGRPVILRPYGPRSAMRNSSMSCAGICAFPATSRSETTMFNLKEYRSSNTRSEEHTSELQSLMRISYAVFCLTKKKQQILTTSHSLTQQLHH